MTTAGVRVGWWAAATVAVLTFAWAVARPGESPLQESPSGFAMVEVEGATRVLEQVSAVRAGTTSSASFTGEELTSLLVHGVPGLLPEGVIEPRVEIQAGLVVVHARVVVADFAAADELKTLRAVLPDSADVVISGRVDTAADGAVFYRMDGARFERVPVPGPVLKAVLAKLPYRGGSSSATIRVRPPSGVGLVYAAGDRLIVHRTEPMVDIVVDEDSP